MLLDVCAVLDAELVAVLLPALDEVPLLTEVALAGVAALLILLVPEDEVEALDTVLF